MTAKEMWQVLDEAGLTPSVHYLAAPLEWRAALERIEAETEESFTQRFLFALEQAEDAFHAPNQIEMDLTNVEAT